MIVHSNFSEPWQVTLVDTGLNTMTGGRIKRIEKYINKTPFMLTYGDGVSDVNITELVKYHKSHGKIATVTAINAEQKFGVLDINKDNVVSAFREKNANDSGMINGGFMVFNPEIFDYIEGDSTVFEKTPLETVAKMGELMAYKHKGFWKCMDTQRDKQQLEALWESGEAPWKKWL
jgi:glucose-1-phosphate cytidylyltransferase